jgi:hypothetical protein
MTSHAIIANTALAGGDYGNYGIFPDKFPLTGISLPGGAPNFPVCAAPGIAGKRLIYRKVSDQFAGFCGGRNQKHGNFSRS